MKPSQIAIRREAPPQARKSGWPGWIGRTIRAFTLRSVPAWAYIAGTNAGGIGNEQRAIQLSAVWRAVRLNAETVASLPIHAYRWTDAGAERVEDREAPTLDLISVSPNADQTPMEFWEDMQAALELTGDAVAVKQKIGDRVAALKWCDPRPGTCKIERDADSNLVYEIRQPDGSYRRYTAADVFHIRGFAVGGDRGLSPVAAGAGSLGLAYAAEDAAQKLYANGLRVSGFLKTNSVFKEGDREKIEANLQRYVGAGNSGGLMVLEGGMDFTKMGMNPLDAELLVTRKFQVEEIGRWFGVPPILLGHAVEGQTMWGCLAPESIVMTETGPKPIIDVRAGERVWSMQDGELRLNRVLRSGKTGTKPVLTIRTRNRTIRATANHEFFVRRRFKAGRVVEWRNVWVRADELTTRDFLMEAHDVDGGVCVVAPNHRRLTVEFMEFCGLYVAEGSMNSRAVAIAHHHDAAYIRHYLDAAESEFDKSDGSPVRIREQVRSSAFSSRAAVAEMEELGFAGTAHTKRVPRWVFGLEKTLILAFLRGYLDGDGHVNGAGEIVWTSVSRMLTEDIRQLCILAGVPVGTPKAERIRKHFNGSPRDATVWRLWCASARHNGAIGSHDPRYIQRLADNASRPRIGRYDAGYAGRGKGGIRHGLGFDLRGVVLNRVLSVSAGKDAIPVYDIEVENAHNFFAEGLLVHNSGVESIVEAWLMLGLRQRLVRNQQAILKRLRTPAEAARGIYFRYNPDALLAVLSTRRMEVLTKSVAGGLLKPNEARAKQDLPRVNGGDELLAQVNLAPIGTLGDNGGNADARVRALLQDWLKPEPHEVARHE